MSTENSLIDADIWISCDDGIHLILMDESNDHFGWVFRQVVGGWPYSVRKATDHEMAHARARQHLRTGVKQIEAEYHPAPQPHPEPIAWMVGTAFWWTKEEAERDAAETGLAVVPVGPMVDTAEVERLESRIKTQRESIRSHVQEVDRLRVLGIKYGLKIEERNDLLRKCLEWITSARDGVLYPIARDFEGVVGRNAEGLGQATPALIDAIDDALSANAAPSALPDPLGCNECAHPDCGKFDGPRQVECRAMADNACARPGASS